jgi:hypothetical protein
LAKSIELAFFLLHWSASWRGSIVILHRGHRLEASRAATNRRQAGVERRRTAWRIERAEVSIVSGIVGIRLRI